MIKSFQGTQRKSFLTSLLCLDIGLSLLSLSAIRNQYRDRALLLKHQGYFISLYHTLGNARIITDANASLGLQRSRNKSKLNK